MRSGSGIQVISERDDCDSLVSVEKQQGANCFSDLIARFGILLPFDMLSGSLVNGRLQIISRLPLHCRNRQQWQYPHQENGPCHFRCSSFLIRVVPQIGHFPGLS